MSSRDGKSGAPTSHVVGASTDPQAASAREQWHAPERTEPVSRTESRVYRDEEPVHEHHPDVDRGTSWTSVIFGWLAALGAAVILAGIVSGIVGAMLGAGATPEAAATESATAGLVGLLITLFLAYLIGGYSAGRMASRSGVKHGLLVPVLGLVVMIVLALAGAIVGMNFIDQLSGVTLPSLPADAPEQNLGTIFTVAGIVALVVTFVGGAIGGAWGARTGRQQSEHRIETEHRAVTLH